VNVMKSMSPNEYLFMRWMSENHPRLLATVEDRRAGLSGVLDSVTGALDALMKTASSGLSTYVQGKQQLALLKTNVQRAKSGLPPLTAEGFQYQVSDADMRAQRFPGGLPVWVWVALAGGVFLLISKD